MIRITPWLAILLCASAAGAQTLVDEGSFTISRGGETIGREQFSIRATAASGGTSYTAYGTTTYSDRRLDPRLVTDAAGAPLRYEVETRIGPERQEMLSGQVQRGRFSARTQTPRGMSAREYIVADGALILDDDIFHQYFFVARSERTGAVPVVVPRRNVQVTMRIEARGNERISIGGTSIESRKLALSEPNGDTREVWVDAQSRVLRVAIPTRGIVAQRDDPPR
ncbi:MAG TPA: hypothetical protein VMM18_00525 [Gemmatimonadaceae bacterium]|nr:hypothetical protein [Gemmatimonadaceae bacterium]